MNYNFKTAFEIIQTAEDQVPMLVDGLLPKIGLASLAGESDLGKSSLLRQLGLSVALGSETFVGQQINADRNSVIYISTEDSTENIGPALKLQIEKLDINPTNELLKKYYFIDKLANIENIIRQIVENDAPDLIVVDCFSDLIKGDINSTTEVRTILNDLNLLACDNQCLVIVLHHIRKSANYHNASKSDLLGSTGFEGKMRTVLMLLKGNYPTLRKLRIVKGNYLPDSIKRNELLLKFEDLIFYKEGESEVSFDDPEQLKKDKSIEVLEQIILESTGDLQTKDLFEKALELDYPYGKSKFYEQIKDFK